MNQHREGINKGEDLKAQPSPTYPPWEPGTPLVEQLTWEARVEKIKASGSTACRRPARVPCWSKFQVESTPSGNPDLGLCSEDWGRSSLRNTFKHKVVNNCLHKSRLTLFSSQMTFRYFRPFLWPKFYRNWWINSNKETGWRSKLLNNNDLALLVKCFILKANQTIIMKYI